MPSQPRRPSGHGLQYTVAGSNSHCAPGRGTSRARGRRRRSLSRLLCLCVRIFSAQLRRRVRFSSLVSSDSKSTCRAGPGDAEWLDRDRFKLCGMTVGNGGANAVTMTTCLVAI